MADQTRIGIVDMGSNAIRFAVAEATAGAIGILESHRLPMRLGRDVFHTGQVPETTLADIVDAFRRFRATCDRLGVRHIRAIATSAMRDARNRDLLVDRVRDAFSPDDVGLLESLALQIGVVVENTKQYRRMQERDRLTVLGQMAAGLAHEIKNPLGAIKGAAQLLGDARAGGRLGPSEREFLGIILEEVERLDRVVGSVLDYARPSKGDVGSVDVNAVVKRTLKLLSSDADLSDARMDLDAALPPVRADAEQLRQVVIQLLEIHVVAGVHGEATERRRRMSVMLRAPHA